MRLCVNHAAGTAAVETIRAGLTVVTVLEMPKWGHGQFVTVHLDVSGGGLSYTITHHDEGGSNRGLVSEK